MAGKTEVPGIYKVRDGILINTDNNALQSYKNRKKRDSMIDDMKKDMDDLRGDIAEIKALLKGLAK